MKYFLIILSLLISVDCLAKAGCKSNKHQCAQVHRAYRKLKPCEKKWIKRQSVEMDKTTVSNKGVHFGYIQHYNVLIKPNLIATR